MSKIDLRLGRELGSFYALIVMNIVIGAVAMGMSVSYGVQGILAMVHLIPGIQALISVPLIAVSFAVFGISIRWLISSAEMFSDAQQISDYYEKKEPEDVGDGITLAIMRTMAFYRERKPLFDRMAMVSRLVGILVLGLATYGIFSALAYPTAAPGEVFLSTVSIAINLTIGGFAVYIPYLFSKLARTWGYRLEHGERVNEELERLLEG